MKNKANCDTEVHEKLEALAMAYVEANPEVDKSMSYIAGFTEAEGRYITRLALLENQVVFKQRIIEDNRKLLDMCVGILNQNNDNG